MPEDQQPDWVVEQRRAIGSRIRDARRRARINQEPLALQIGVDRRTIQRIEAGQTDARLSWLQRIAATLEIPLAELVDAPRPPR